MRTFKDVVGNSGLCQGWRTQNRTRSALTDLALELAQKAARFRRSLPESLSASLADLVRAMNCYYSNLIEGHDTHPVDIEPALKNDYSKETMTGKDESATGVAQDLSTGRREPWGSSLSLAPCSTTSGNDKVPTSLLVDDSNKESAWSREPRP